MSEEVLPLPLSGEEIIVALLAKAEQKLRADCFLNPAAAYESFEGTIRIQMRMKDLGREVEVLTEAPVVLGDPIADDDEALTAMDESLEVTSAAPNDVRVETGQPVPVLTETADGKKEIKKIHYARKKPAVKKKAS